MSTLVVLVGPTGVGKTDLSIRIAKQLGSPIISADSRQLYRELKVGTAPPTPQQLEEVQHYFIQSRSIEDDYTAGRYELDALQLMAELFKTHKHLLMVGGSGLYVDAVCKGIDDIPVTESSLRAELMERLESEGLAPLRAELEQRDPLVCESIDLNNPQRVVRALEVCITSGGRYSDLKKNFSKKRDFDIVTIGLNRDREELYNRINTRVDDMLVQGLEEEARALYPHKGLNALKTVGYRELFDYFDGKQSFEKAVELIKRNSRHYAKRQLTWFARNSDTRWFYPDSYDEIMTTIEPLTKKDGC